MDFDGNGQKDGIATYVNRAGQRAAFLFLSYGQKTKFHQLSEAGPEDIIVNVYQPAEYMTACSNGNTPWHECRNNTYQKMPHGGFYITAVTQQNRQAKTLAFWHNGSFRTGPFFSPNNSRPLRTDPGDRSSDAERLAYIKSVAFGDLNNYRREFWNRVAVSRRFPGISWANDGCSFLKWPHLGAYNVVFSDACIIHDFGYRNLSVNEWTLENKNSIEEL